MKDPLSRWWNIFWGYRELAEDETRSIEVDEEAKDEEIKVWF